MDEELSAFLNERTTRAKELLDRHTVELQNFDLQTTTMGLDLVQIVEATRSCYQDDDLDSVRGSVLSLTPSSSRNSFSPSLIH